jgi:hypothetical protein
MRHLPCDEERSLRPNRIAQWNQAPHQEDGGLAIAGFLFVRVPNLSPDHAFNLSQTRGCARQMRYYFNVRAGDTLIADEEGVDLPGLAQVAEEARQAARDLLANRVQHGEWLNGEMFEVADEGGNVVLEFPFTAVLMLR